MCELRELNLRRAMWEDGEFLLELRNDETVRAASFQTELISREQHFKWFQKKLTDKNTWIYILQKGKQRIGQVRIDLQGGYYQISYAICAKERGKGYGKWMLREMEERIKREAGIRGEKLTGEVKEDNIGSQKIFEDLGYIKKKSKYGYQYEKKL